MTERKRNKIWETKYVSGDAERDAAIEKMARELGVSPLFAMLLYNRGYTDAESASRFLRFKEEDFHDPFLLRDMDVAVERILRAVDGGERIYVYGDYDVDGVTSASLIYLYLTSLRADVRIKIPKREGEGYGVSTTAVDAIAEDGATLIITVDTGITAAAEVEYAKRLGIDFVITDHHECHGELPNAVAVVNPHRPDCSYPFAELAGVGVIFKTVCACEMRRCVREGKSAEEGIRRVCAEFCELVAVGTIADVMPLVDENRPIVNLGFSGNAKIDYEIAELMASYPDPGLFVLDYAPNCDAKLIEEKAERFFRIIRDAHPDVPVVFVALPPYPRKTFSTKQGSRMDEINAAQLMVYQKLKKSGEKNIYYVKSAGMLGDDNESTVDGTHFTDLGMMRYVDHILPTIRKALK